MCYTILVKDFYEELFMPIIPFKIGDMLVLKKKHPCSSDIFKVMRVGSDIRIICDGCGRDLMLPREKLEKMIKRVIEQ